MADSGVLRWSGLTPGPSISSRPDLPGDAPVGDEGEVQRLHGADRPDGEPDGHPVRAGLHSFGVDNVTGA